MSDCPRCRAEQDPEWQDGVFLCGSSIAPRDGRFTQEPACRARELALIVIDVLPLARAASCGHAAQGDAQACCRWAELVRRIEAAGVGEEL